MALVAATATSLMATPAQAAASTSAKLIRTKIYSGHCEDTCRIRVKITNISRKNLYYVKLNARLKVNGRKVGSCYDSVGSIRARKVKWASCTVRTERLSDMWNAYLDGRTSFRPYANTYVSYKYYR
ncbi:hypothetical protein FAF44_24790 [Nonomuraea sp. MG754425]|uniref:hypothetical protein n=1 Tax=Nonomuraea sp. MG754425 TaxID=2570319 RepID=UPI001F345D9D|nr:hypothetical protein [Nonomuraea sp. MG754425]MCF6471586.1 hypothetical protein [Nonomuraea sp. MG754425]